MRHSTKKAGSELQLEPAKKIRRTPIVYRNNPALSNLFRWQKQLPNHTKGRRCYAKL
jgi:hypothetical protein